MKNVHLTLTFYKPPPEDPWFNRLVAFCDGPYSHVEISFSDGMSSSIFAGERVFMHTRTFANPNYTMVTIPVTQEQCLRAKEFCREQASRGVQFDGYGMYASFLLPDMGCGEAPSSKAGTFCSKHVVMALQHAGVDGFAHMRPSKMTPSGLYREVQRTYAGQTVASTTPYRLQLLNTMMNE